MDALEGQRLVLDFGANRMRVEPSPRRPRRADREVVIEGRERDGQLVLDGAVIDGVPVDIIIDTGLEVSLGNEMLRRLLRTRQERPIALRGATGEAVVARYALVDEFRIGGVRLSNAPMAFADAYIFERMRMTRRPALFLGMETLRLFERVTIDFANRQASFVVRSS
jgi:predicted aspartyl protease